MKAESYPQGISLRGTINLAKNMKKKRTTTKNQSAAKPLVLGTLIVIGLLVLLFVLTQMGENAKPKNIFQEQPSIENQPVTGEPNAPVTIVEFGDYKCPSCKAWGEQLYPQLKKDYIDKGKVKFAYINVLFHGPESELASLAAESVFAQDPETFWLYHKDLFNAQPVQDHDALWVTPEKILELAKPYAQKIDLNKLQEDIKNKTTSPQIKLDTELVEKYKIQQTPTVMVNGIMLDNPFDYGTLKSIIDSELGDK